MPVDITPPKFSLAAGQQFRPARRPTFLVLLVSAVAGLL
jgi:hypothetical protein